MTSDIKCLFVLFQDDYELVCRMIFCPNWPECCSPLSAVFDLVRVVQQWFADNQNGPVVVVDRSVGFRLTNFGKSGLLAKAVFIL